MDCRAFVPPSTVTVVPRPRQVAFNIMTGIPDSDSTDAAAKWKQLSDLALATSNLSLAHDCSLRAGDLGGLLLLHTSSGNAEGLRELAAKASAQGR